MPQEKKTHHAPGVPADMVYDDDGKPAHDNPRHAGIHSHLRRAVIDPEEENRYHIHARPQCAYIKSMKRL